MNLGDELVRAYGSAGQATTSGLIGQARENAVKTKLESILPGGVGVGTGCVIDSEGNSSRQMDVVLYEKGFCPIFCVHILLSLRVCDFDKEQDRKEGITRHLHKYCVREEAKEISLRVCDFCGFDKEQDRKEGITRHLHKYCVREEAKEIRRADRSGSGYIWQSFVRRYLDKNTLFVDGDWTTFQNSRSATQIFSFGLGQAFSVRPETMIKHTKQLYSEVSEELRPNAVLTLEQEIMTAASSEQMSYTALGSPGIVYGKAESSFQWLVAMLNDIIQEGVTASRSAYRRYVIPQRVEVTHTFIPSN